MHESTAGILFAAILIVPTCVGLWFGDSDTPKADESMIERLRERRVAQRRLGRRARDTAPVNYVFLETLPPDASMENAYRDPSCDRRAGGRRAQDRARGERLVEGAGASGVAAALHEALSLAASRSAVHLRNDKGDA